MLRSANQGGYRAALWKPIAPGTASLGVSLRSANRLLRVIRRGMLVHFCWWLIADVPRGMHTRGPLNPIQPEAVLAAQLLTNRHATGAQSDVPSSFSIISILGKFLMTATTAVQSVPAMHCSQSAVKQRIFFLREIQDEGPSALFVGPHGRLDGGRDSGDPPEPNLEPPTSPDPAAWLCTCFLCAVSRPVGSCPCVSVALTRKRSSGLRSMRLGWVSPNHLLHLRSARDRTVSWRQGSSVSVTAMVDGGLARAAAACAALVRQVLTSSSYSVLRYNPSKIPT